MLAAWMFEIVGGVISTGGGGLELGEAIVVVAVVLDAVGDEEGVGEGLGEVVGLVVVVGDGEGLGVGDGMIVWIGVVGCAGIAGTAGVAGVAGVVLVAVVVAEIAGVAGIAGVVDECVTVDRGGVELNGIVELIFSCNPGAVSNPEGIFPDSPAPCITNSFNLESVLGPTTPMDSIPCFS